MNSNTGRTMGIVEKFRARRISGWVATDEPGEVIFKVNDLEVARAPIYKPVAVNGGEYPYGFSRNISGVWPYLGDGDVLAVEFEGKPLPISGVGTRYVHKGEEPSRFAELQERFSTGCIITKLGRLAVPFDQRTAGIDNFFKNYEKLRAAVQSKLDLTLFPIYGTLLGCVRERNFIAHDNDIDITYISKFDDPESVRAEFVTLCEYIVELGFRGIFKGEVSSNCFGIKSPSSFDIYPSWFNTDGGYQLSVGYHGTQLTKNEKFFEFVERPMGSHTFMVPANAEEIVAQIYGSGWKVPDPGFTHYTATRKINPEYKPTAVDLQRVFWKQFYKHNQITGGSPFAQHVVEQLDPKSLVIEFGCGTGRDSIFFSKAGLQVLGSDAVAEALERANESKAEAGLGCRFERVNVGSAEEIAAFLNSAEVQAAYAEGREIVIYMRFFLHAITDAVQTVLFDSLVSGLKAFTLFAEFRTDKDKGLPKDNAEHFRRFVAGADMEAAMTASGLRVVSNVEGFGFSPYKGEDPHLCRIVAKRG